jgi:nucleotide sugar dehydrogenase
MRLGIIGMGHVGRAMAGLFSPFADLVTYDQTQGDTYPKAELLGCAFAMVCVGTPMRPDGSCDLTQVEAAINRLPVERVLLRSTVPPGTTDRLAAVSGKQVCFCPEYFGESNYLSNFHAGGPSSVPFMIVGGPPSARRTIIDDLSSMMGPDKTYFQCSAREAEIVKYMENSYLAMKVTFVNEFFEICRTFDADWHTVREGWLLDPRVERSHTGVFVAARGFSGRCLPKDVSAIIEASKAAGYAPQLLEEVMVSNRRFQTLSVDLSPTLDQPLPATPVRLGGATRVRGD